MNNIQQSIWITQKAYNKMFQYVISVDTEVSGLGIVEEIEGIGVTITDVYLLDQASGLAFTELNPIAVSRLLIELSRQGKEKNLLLWWHSHANMETFWSSTDIQTIQGLKSGSYFISIVVNKRFDIKARIELYSPIKMSLDNVVVRVLPEVNEVSQEIIDELKARVWLMPMPQDPFTQTMDNTQFDDYYPYQDEQELYEQIMNEVMAESAGKGLSEAEIEKLYQARLAQYGIVKPGQNQNGLPDDNNGGMR